MGTHLWEEECRDESFDIIMYEGGNIPVTPKRAALYELTNASKHHVSPTANLKLLTSVALLPMPPSTAQRKEKSLQILCDRFLSLYPLHGNETFVEIHLDSTAARLGVEKRRMYDIINILEAMQCAVHRRKNTYAWHGATRMGPFLRALKRQGQALHLSEALRGQAPKPVPPKHKTLGVLAQRFLMLFLVEIPNTLINLEMAVGVLIDTSPDETMSHLTAEQLERRHKSKVRRLYDIANVLISLGLIEKVSGNSILKKPVFKYKGPTKFKGLLYCNPTPSPVTPIIIRPGSNVSLGTCVARSKRKLVFSSPSGSLSSVSRMSRLPSSPQTPSHKWHEILQVADMELNRLNSSSVEFKC